MNDALRELGAALAATPPFRLIEKILDWLNRRLSP